MIAESSENLRLPRNGLLIDTNLLVLLLIGLVNPARIETFKRTRQYTRADYDLLINAVSRFSDLYTLAQVMAEVSNLTDLSGPESALARHALKELLTTLDEPVISSIRAATNVHYTRLGLTDAAVIELARELNLTVLTDDLDLYLALTRVGVTAFNFTHLRSQAWGL